MENTNLNVAPYYDDFAEDKNFHRVLFRPGFSVQARELTQSQSILQNQIESIFKKYICNYVSCHMCQTHDTILIKDQITRIYFLQCDLCGSKRSV